MSAEPFTSNHSSSKKSSSGLSGNISEDDLDENIEEAKDDNKVFLRTQNFNFNQHRSIVRKSMASCKFNKFKSFNKKPEMEGDNDKTPKITSKQFDRLLTEQPVAKKAIQPQKPFTKQ